METGDPVGSNSRTFTIHLNHGGNFGEWSYFDGEVVSMDFDVDMVSLVRIDVWVKYLGHIGNMIYYWRQPGKDFNNGLKVLDNDACVYEMALHAIDDGDGAVDVYVRHLSDEELDKVVNPVRKSSVVIKEIEEEDVSNSGMGKVHKGSSVGRKANKDKLNSAPTEKLLGSSAVDNAPTKKLLIHGVDQCVNLEDSGSDTNIEDDNWEFENTVLDMVHVGREVNDTEEQPEIEQIVEHFEREEEAVNESSGSEFHNKGEEEADSNSSESTDDSEHETDEGETESDNESESEEYEVTEELAATTNEPSQVDNNDQLVHVGVVPDPANRNIIEDSDFDIVDGDDDLQDVLRETGQLNENGVLVDVPVGGFRRSMGGRPKGNNEKPSCSGVDASLRFEVEEGSSDYGPDSDEIVTASESGSDTKSNNKPKLRFSRFNAERNMRNPKFEMGMLFKNKDEFKDACKQWGIKNRWQVYFPVNDAIRCRCKCYKKCSFWIYASKMDRKCKEDKTFQVRSFNLKHTCGKGNSNFHVTSKYLSQKYLEEFRDDPQWNLKAFISRVKKDMKMTIDRMKAWRARDYAVKSIIGDEDQQYSRLYDYRLELLRTNPGSSVEFKEQRGRFEGMYVCVGALKEAFKSGCRKLICLDGCFLKGTYGGQLLSATGIDPNDCMFPLAFAIVKVENTENWDWFLELIREDFQINNSYHWVFMSDRQKGLIRAVENQFPYSEHRLCVRHMETNFRSKFKDIGLVELLKKAARSTYQVQLNKCLKEIEALSVPARAWLDERPAQHWSRACFKPTAKCDILLNNLSECFNKYILDAREKPILTMFEMIRTQLMKRLHTKKLYGRRMKGSLCPKIQKKLEKIKKLSFNLTAESAGGDKFQVNGFDGQFVVDTAAKTCTCRRWQISAIPCVHACACIFENNEQPEDFVDDCYKVETYRRVYNHVINPLNGPSLWEPHPSPPGIIIPPSPVKKKKRGRRAKTRRKEAEEIRQKAMAKNKNKKKQKLPRKGTIKIKCSVCKAVGHNKRFHGSRPTDATTSTSSTRPPTQGHDFQQGHDFGTRAASSPNVTQLMMDGTARVIRHNDNMPINVSNLRANTTLGDSVSGNLSSLGNLADSSWIDRAFCSQTENGNATGSQRTSGSTVEHQATQAKQTARPVQDKGKGVKRKQPKGRDVPSRYKQQKK